MNERQQQKPNDQCLDMGLLVYLRDGELTADESAKARAHLALCPDCAADERGVTNSGREVYELLAALDPPADEIPDRTTALVTIQARIDREDNHKDRPESLHELAHLSRGNRRRRYGRLVAAVAAAILVALLLLPNAGALADQFLALFRAQQFQPVNVDPQRFVYDLMSNLRDFSDMQVQYSRAPDLADATQAQAEQYIHFPLLLPSHLPPGVGHTPHFSLISSANATFTFNSTKVQAYLRQTGQSGIHIPAILIGATFSITSDPGVIINYASNCRKTDDHGASSSTTSPLLLCGGGTPFYAAEIPSPVVQATGKASLKDLRDFLLSLPRLSPELHAMLQQLNLERGIVPLPIPSEVDAQQVTIHGASGVVLVDNSLKVGGVMWQAHGIIYMVATITANSTELLDSANSLG